MTLLHTRRGRSRRGQRRDPQYGAPTSDGVLYILHMGDGTIPTVRKNKFTENRQSVNETVIFRRQRGSV